jgi:hypothetical protein
MIVSLAATIIFMELKSFPFASILASIMSVFLGVVVFVGILSFLLRDKIDWEVAEDPRTEPAGALNEGHRAPRDSK